MQKLKKARSRKKSKPAGRSRSARTSLTRAARYARWIQNTGEHEEYPGQSLATRSHLVIVTWASRRKAAPATAPGTRHDGRAGVLRFDFPGYGGRELEHISWGDWFKSFDQRDLTFLLQEHLKSGRQSNFFKLDNPRRENA